MPRPSPYGVRGLYKDDEDRYQIDLRFRNPITQKSDRYSETLPDGTTLGTAQRRARDVLNAALSGTLLKRGADTAPETLGEAFDRYLEVCRTNGGKSDPEYKRRHRKHWVKTLGEGFRLDAFSELTIEKHKRRRVGGGKAPGTVNRELVTIKHFLNRAVDWGWIPKRPKIVLLAEPPERVRWLTEEERVRLAAELALPQRGAIRRVCSAALLSGQRLGKVIGLLKTDVDFAARVVTVADMAKGGKRKTTHVPITDALEAVLREAMADAGEDCPYVFAAGRRVKGKKKPYTQSGVSSFFAKVCEGAQISDFHFHDLRHDFATTLARGGTGLHVLQKLLGHATPAMTQRYAHLADHQLAAAASVARPLPVAPSAPKKKAKKKPSASAAQRAS